MQRVSQDAAKISTIQLFNLFSLFLLHRFSMSINQDHDNEDITNITKYVTNFTQVVTNITQNVTNIT